MDDRKAIRQLKEGNIGGLEYLIARYQQKGLRAAYLITSNLSLAEDAVQESFIRIYEKIQFFDSERPFEPYFLRCVVNTAINGNKKTSRWCTLEDDPELEQLSDLFDQTISVENHIEYMQLREKIQNALAFLSPQQRAVVVQRYYLNMSEQEMADTLQVAPGTIKWLLNKARKRLRSLIESGREQI